MVFLVSSSVTILVIKRTIPALISNIYQSGNGSPDFQPNYYFGNQGGYY